MKSPTPFSHSSLKLYETCARRFQEERVLKLHPYKDTDATMYGKELHTAAEEFIRDGTPLPAHFGFMQPTLDTLKAKIGRKFCEYEMGMAIDGKPCGFKDAHCWARGIADLLIVDDDGLTAWVVDYKSGKDKYPDTSQLDLLSLLVYANFPHVRLVKSGLLFVVKDRMVKHKTELDQKDDLMWSYRERVARMEASFATGVFNPTQNGLCRKWCGSTTCHFSGKYE